MALALTSAAPVSAHTVGSAPAVIDIPRIGTHAEIVPLGQEDDGTMQSLLQQRDSYQLDEGFGARASETRIDRYQGRMDVRRKRCGGAATVASGAPLHDYDCRAIEERDTAHRVACGGRHFHVAPLERRPFNHERRGAAAA